MYQVGLTFLKVKTKINILWTWIYELNSFHTDATKNYKCIFLEDKIPRIIQIDTEWMSESHKEIYRRSTVINKQQTRHILRNTRNTTVMIKDRVSHLSLSPCEGPGTRPLSWVMIYTPTSDSLSHLHSHTQCTHRRSTPHSWQGTVTLTKGALRHSTQIKK